VTTAFVFAGGGSLGAVEVGMLKALVERSVRPDFVVGASVGAINAAYFAGSPDAAGVERLAGIWRRLRRADVFPVSLMQGLRGLLRGRAFLDPSALRALIRRELPYQRLEQARLPCHIVASNVLDGSEVVLSSGSASEALLASAAIPGLFPPVEIGGRHLIDGGISSNTPLSAAIALGAKRVVVLPTGYACALTAPPAGALAVALHALTLLIARQLVVDVLRWRERCEVRVVPPLCPIRSSPGDFSSSRELMERAEKSTRDWLAAGGLERKDLPHELSAHEHELV
jgi:NTE family protein